jgi:hypothetical protein
MKTLRRRLLFGLTPDQLAHRENAWRVHQQLHKRFIGSTDRGEYIEFDHAGRLFRIWVFNTGLRIVDSHDFRPAVQVECDNRELPAVIESTFAAFFSDIDSTLAAWNKETP